VANLDDSEEADAAPAKEERLLVEHVRPVFDDVFAGVVQAIRDALGSTVPYQKVQRMFLEVEKIVDAAIKAWGTAEFERVSSLQPESTTFRVHVSAHPSGVALLQLAGFAPGAARFRLAAGEEQKLRLLTVKLGLQKLAANLRARGARRWAAPEGNVSVIPTGTFDDLYGLYAYAVVRDTVTVRESRIEALVKKGLTRPGVLWHLGLVHEARLGAHASALPACMTSAAVPPGSLFVTMMSSEHQHVSMMQATADFDREVAEVAANALKKFSVADFTGISACGAACKVNEDGRHVVVLLLVGAPTFVAEEAPTWNGRTLGEETRRFANGVHVAESSEAWCTALSGQGTSVFENGVLRSVADPIPERKAARIAGEQEAARERQLEALARRAQPEGLRERIVRA
jgi:hypothetical protein